MSLLANREKQFLLELARRSLILAVEGDQSLDELPQGGDFPERFFQPCGAFVTLRRRGRLRGCIGQLASNLALVRVIADCARAAALEDPRFGPVDVPEMHEIEIELSILSPPEDVTPERIEPGRHGLIVSRGWQRGLLLPQVAAEFHWTVQRFLQETCLKGGFAPDAWKEASTRVQAFTAEVFSEASLQAEVETQPKLRS